MDFALSQIGIALLFLTDDGHVLVERLPPVFDTQQECIPAARRWFHEPASHAKVVGVWCEQVRDPRGFLDGEYICDYRSLFTLRLGAPVAMLAPETEVLPPDCFVSTTVTAGLEAGVTQ